MGNHRPGPITVTDGQMLAWARAEAERDALRAEVERLSHYCSGEHMTTEGPVPCQQVEDRLEDARAEVERLVAENRRLSETQVPEGWRVEIRWVGDGRWRHAVPFLVPLPPGRADNPEEGNP